LEAVRKYSGGFEGSVLTYDDVTGMIPDNPTKKFYQHF